MTIQLDIYYTDIGRKKKDKNSRTQTIYEMDNTEERYIIYIYKKYTYIYSKYIKEIQIYYIYIQIETNIQHIQRKEIDKTHHREIPNT